MISMKMPKIKIHYSLFILLLIGFITNAMIETLIFLSIVIFHELGHLLMIKITRGTYQSLTIGVFGGLINGYNQSPSIMKSLLVDFGRPHYQCCTLNNL